MNERLTIQNLIDLLASKHGMSKKDAEAFVKEFFLLIEQALENESYVKIKGLGTFKLIDVDSRESVNVNTGERFQIQGHTKVSFTPDGSLKDAINKPFAHFETVLLNEKTLLDDTQTEEPEGEDILEEEIPEVDSVNEEETSPEVESNINSAYNEPALISTPMEIEPVLEETVHPAEEAAAIVYDNQPISTPQEDIQVTAEEIIAKELEKVNSKKESSEIYSSSNSKKKGEAPKEKSSSIYLIIIILTTLLICGGAVLFIYYPDLFSSSVDKNKIDMPIANPVQETPLLIDTLENNQDTVGETLPEVPEKVTSPSVSKEEQQVSATPKAETKTKADPVYQDSATYTISGTKTTHTIKAGETLTKVSLHFYGTKALWPYIVKHNPGVIKNPDNVPYGTTIKIPELSKQ